MLSTSLSHFSAEHLLLNGLFGDALEKKEGVRGANALQRGGRGGGGRGGGDTESGRREGECAKDEGKKGGRSGYLSIYLHDCFIDLGLSYRSGPFTPVLERQVSEGLVVEFQVLFYVVIFNHPCASKAVALVGHGGEDGDETTLLHLHTYTLALRPRIRLVPDSTERRQGGEGRGDHREEEGVAVSRILFTRSCFFRSSRF